MPALMVAGHYLWLAGTCHKPTYCVMYKYMDGCVSSAWEEIPVVSTIQPGQLS